MLNGMLRNIEGEAMGWSVTRGNGLVYRDCPLQFEGITTENKCTVHVSWTEWGYLNTQSNRKLNGTNGDDTRWSFTDLARLSVDEPLELFVAVEERVELWEGRHGWASEVAVVRVGEGGGVDGKGI
jgi:hypothetical protein